MVGDEVEQPGGDNADGRGSVLGRFDQCSAKFSRIRYRGQRGGLKDVINSQS